jgi:hypothetical protein
MKISRRQFLLTAAASAPALLGGTAPLATPDVEPPYKDRIWWNLEQFDKNMDFRLGELGVVMSRPGHYQHQLLYHASIATHWIMPSMFCDGKCAVSKIEKLHSGARHTIYSGPHYTRLLQICPKDMAFFISTNHYATEEEVRDLKKIAVERNLAIVIGFRSNWAYDYHGPWGMMRPADVVLTTEKDEDSPKHMVLSILKNRRGDQFRSYWHQVKGNLVSSECGAWC